MRDRPRISRASGLLVLVLAIVSSACGGDGEPRDRAAESTAARPSGDVSREELVRINDGIDRAPGSLDELEVPGPSELIDVPWSVQRVDGRKLMLRSIISGCQWDFRATVHETDDSVAIRMFRPADARAERCGGMTSIGFADDVEVQLSEPLGSRRLLSVLGCVPKACDPPNAECRPYFDPRHRRASGDDSVEE